MNYLSTAAPPVLMPSAPLKLAIPSERCITGPAVCVLILSPSGMWLELAPKEIVENINTTIANSPEDLSFDELYEDQV